MKTIKTTILFSLLFAFTSAVFADDSSKVMRGTEAKETTLDMNISSLHLFKDNAVVINIAMAEELPYCYVVVVDEEGKEIFGRAYEHTDYVYLKLNKKELSEDTVYTVLIKNDAHQLIKKGKIIL